jgi:hypothetical protein
VLRLLRLVVAAMRITYDCVCGSHIDINARRLAPELALAWQQHAGCPALWARYGPADQGTTLELSPWIKKTEETEASE